MLVGNNFISNETLQQKKNLQKRNCGLKKLPAEFWPIKQVVPI